MKNQLLRTEDHRSISAQFGNAPWQSGSNLTAFQPGGFQKMHPECKGILRTRTPQRRNCSQILSSHAVLGSECMGGTKLRKKAQSTQAALLFACCKQGGIPCVIAFHEFIKLAPAGRGRKLSMQAGCIPARAFFMMRRSQTASTAPETAPQNRT